MALVLGLLLVADPSSSSAETRRAEPGSACRGVFAEIAGTASRSAPAAVDPTLEVATLDGAPILAADVEHRIASELHQIAVRRHRLLEEAARSQADERLLRAEAERRRTTVDEMLAGSGQEVSAGEVDRYLRENPAEGVDPDDEAVRERVRLYLASTAPARRREELLEELRASHVFRMEIEPPEAPRIGLPLEGLPHLTLLEPAPGSQAVVDVVHVSSFRCRRCRTPTSEGSLDAVTRLLEELPEMVGDLDVGVRLHLFGVLSSPEESELRAALLASAAWARLDSGAAAARRETYWTFVDQLLAGEVTAATADATERSNRGSDRGPTAQDWARNAGLIGPTDLDDEGFRAMEEEHLPALRQRTRTAQERSLDFLPVLLVDGRRYHPTYPYEELVQLVCRSLAERVLASHEPPP